MNVRQNAPPPAMRNDFFRLWVYLSATPLLGLTLTLVAYQIGLWSARRANNHPLINPVLVAMLVVASTLALSGVSYQQYFEGAQFVHFLLGTATVALGLPFYERLAELRASWRSLVTGLVCGSVAATATVYGLAKYLGVSESTARSLLPKSVTAPLAMGISEAIGGVPALSAVFAILTGVLGAATGKIVFDLLAIKSMMVRGFALGAQAHGIGTARAYLVSADAGAFAGLALGLHGLMASLVLPWVVRWIL